MSTPVSTSVFAPQSAQTLPATRAAISPAASKPQKIILALDFDGVLHPNGCEPAQELCHRSNFEDLMREFPGVSIVISSAWRIYTPLERLKGMFRCDVAMRIVGVTPDYKADRPHCRQREIESWVRQNAAGSRWIAVDDYAGGFDSGCPNLLLVPQGSVGLQSAQIEELRFRLDGMLSTETAPVTEAPEAAGVPDLEDKPLASRRARMH